MKTNYFFRGSFHGAYNGSLPSITKTLFIFLITVSLHAQWMQSEGPYAGYTTAMTSVGDYIYASNRYYGQGDGRIYRSSNFGSNWEPADGNMDPALNYVQQFANIGEIILAAANHLYKTTNQGTNWAIREAGLPVQALSVETINGEFWAGTNGAGIYKSTNLGESYVSMNTGILLDAGTVIVYDIAYLNGNIFLATEGGGGPARLYRSSNNGASWEFANNGLPLGTNPHYFAINGNTLFVSSDGDFAEYEYGLYKSEDNGNTWTPCNNGIPVILNGNTGNVFTHEGVVYVSTTFPDESPKVYKSTDNGASFMPASDGLRNQNQQAYSFTAAGDYIFAGLGWYGSVFRTQNQGENWEEARKGLANSTVFSLLEHNGRLYAGSQEGLFYTTDMGENWTEMQNGLPFGRPITTMEKNANSIYLGTDQFGVFKSDDGGNTWVQINNGFTGTFSESIEDLLYYDGALYAATWDGVYKTTNNGVSWTLASTGLPTAFGGSLVTVNAITQSDGVLFAGTVLEGIFKSTDGGATWTPASSGLTFYAKTIHDFTVVGADIYAATDDGVYKSTNQGTSWQVQPIVDAGPFRTIYSANGVLYASNYGPTVLTGYNVFTSSNNGLSWQEMEDGMFPNARVTAFQLHNGVIFGGTDTRSVWTYGQPLSTYQPTANPHKASIIPNPSNGNFSIQLNSVIGKVDLSLFNTFGQLVYRASVTPVGGLINVGLNEQPKGIYLLQIKTENEFLSTKVMIDR